MKTGNRVAVRIGRAMVAVEGRGDVIAIGVDIDGPTCSTFREIVVPRGEAWHDFEACIASIIRTHPGAVHE